jgi:hypothetical protein
MVVVKEAYQDSWIRFIRITPYMPRMNATRPAITLIIMGIGSFRCSCGVIIGGTTVIAIDASKNEDHVLMSLIL